MHLQEHPKTIRWLTQFAHRDVPLARLLLQSLKLVSYDKFESSISETLLALHDNGERRTAVIPIRKPAKTRGTKKEQRIRYSSAERIGHFLVNLERAFPKRFMVSPTIESMRAERTDLIVLVDDIIGSGKRVIEFWKKSLSPSMKSWLSYKKCKLIIVTYAAHASGVSKIKKGIKYFRDKGSLSICHELPKKVRAWDQKVEELCERYANRTSKHRAALGFGDVMTPIVFQHGCPNNAPVILWSGGPAWEALFPNRSIPSELYECFDGGQHADIPEILWRSGQYRLGLQILEAIETRDLEDFQIGLLTVLGLLLRGVRCNALINWIMLTNSEIDEILKTASDSGLIDDARRVTSFGRDLVERFRHVRLSQDKAVPGNEIFLRFYYPQQYMGVQGKSSVGSA